MTNLPDGVYTHDPDARLDYPFDWKPFSHGKPGKVDWLAEGETITSFEFISTEGVTLGTSGEYEPSEADGKVTVWVLGAEPPRQKVTCRINTDQGRRDDRTITLNVRER